MPGTKKRAIESTQPSQPHPTICEVARPDRCGAHFNRQCRLVAVDRAETSSVEHRLTRL